MQVFFIGCLHFSHPWMAHHRGFQDEFYHDEHLIECWNSVVPKKRGMVYILGDVTMESKEPYYQLDRLNGVKRIVLGNHDLPNHTRELLKYVETVAGMIDYKGFCLTHAPIHPNEMGFYRGNIHAHTHENDLHEVVISNRYNDRDAKLEPTLHKYYNVDAKRVGYKPRTLEEIINRSYENTTGIS